MLLLTVLPPVLPIPDVRSFPESTTIGPDPPVVPDPGLGRPSSLGAPPTLTLDPEPVFMIGFSRLVLLLELIASEIEVGINMPPGLELLLLLVGPELEAGFFLTSFFSES